MAKRARPLSERERAERRRAERERLQRAAEELLSSEGWVRWVRVRAMFRSYSAGNCALKVMKGIDCVVGRVGEVEAPRVVEPDLLVAVPEPA